MIKQWFSKRKWKGIFTSMMYLAVSVLLLHDVFIIIAHSISPTFMEYATPYILDKLLAALFASLSM